MEGNKEIISPPVSNAHDALHDCTENGGQNIYWTESNGGHVTDNGITKSAVEIQEGHDGVDIALGRIQIPSTGSNVSIVYIFLSDVHVPFLSH